MLLMSIQPMTLLSWGILNFTKISHKLSQNHLLPFCTESQRYKIKKTASLFYFITRCLLLYDLLFVICSYNSNSLATVSLSVSQVFLPSTILVNPYASITALSLAWWARRSSLGMVSSS